MKLDLQYIFVLCVGRTASTSVASAFGHAENFTAGHETRSRQLLPGRLAYPVNHIEVDNRLVHYLELLERDFGERAAYIHLRRDQQAIADSYLKRWNLTVSAVRAHQVSTLLRPGYCSRAEAYTYALDYVSLVDQRIEAFLSRQRHTETIELANIEEDFERIWKAFDLAGDLQKAIESLSKRENQNVHHAPRKRASRVVSKASRLVNSFPSFVRDV